MQMNATSLVRQKAEWEKLGVRLPAFDHAAMAAATKAHPVWVHFGAGNIFRGFIAALQQRLLNEGLADRGEAEAGAPLTVVATGGLATGIIPCCRRKILFDGDLLFKGLAVLYARNAGQQADV